MTTIWRTVHDGTLQRIYSSPGRAELIEEAYRKVPDDLRAFTFQHSTRAPNIADKEAAVEMLVALETGALSIVSVDVGEGPGADADRKGNNEKLAGLAPPMRASFEPGLIVGMLNCDGYVAWDEPIQMETSEGPVNVAPRGVPLEVGYMPSGKAVYGIRKIGLARWPYGSEFILVALPTPCAFPAITTHYRSENPRDIPRTDRECSEGAA